MASMNEALAREIMDEIMEMNFVAVWGRSTSTRIRFGTGHVCGDMFISLSERKLEFPYLLPYCCAS